MLPHTNTHTHTHKHTHTHTHTYIYIYTNICLSAPEEIKPSLSIYLQNAGTTPWKIQKKEKKRKELSFKCYE